MIDDRIEFGNYLRKLIKERAMRQFDFYTEVGITKPYFYDILSGKVNPPPPDIQYKMLDTLKADALTRRTFLNLAAQGRDEGPADIAAKIKANPKKLDAVRELLGI